MSWPWAQVSISRAVANERALIIGPYHGSRAFGSSAASASASCIEIGCHSASIAGPSSWPYFSRASELISRPCANCALSAAASRTKASGSFSASIEVSSKKHRWAISSQGDQP